jgi:hypothetical protein
MSARDSCCWIGILWLGTPDLPSAGWDVLREDIRPMCALLDTPGQGDPGGVKWTIRNPLLSA